MKCETKNSIHDFIQLRDSEYCLLLRIIALCIMVIMIYFGIVESHAIITQSYTIIRVNNIEHDVILKSNHTEHIFGGLIVDTTKRYNVGDIISYDDDNIIRTSIPLKNRNR